MRLFSCSLIVLLALTACAAPATGTPAGLQFQIEPTTVPANPTAAPPETTAQATFEESLLVAEWKGRSEGNLLFPLDPASGNALPEFTPIPLGQSYSYAFSPDRQTLAAVTFPNDNIYRGGLLLIDLRSWTTQTIELETSGWVSAMTFSPDGKRLAIAQGESAYHLTLVDLEKGIITAQREEDSLIMRMKFTTDSESLMLYGTVTKNRYTVNEVNGGAPLIKLLDVADLSPRWSAELETVHDGIFPKDENVTPDLSQPGTALYISPAVVFAPDQNTLYVVHADSDQLTIANFDSQEVQTVEIQAELTWFERLLSLTAGVAHAKVSDGTTKQAVLSPDGQLLYVVGLRYESFLDKMGNLQMNQTPLGLEIIRTNDGSRVERFETDSSDLSISTDGQILYLRDWTDTAPWTKIFDLNTYQVITQKEWIYAAPALRINGEPLLVSTHSTGEFAHHMSILSPDGSEVLSEWTSSGYITPITP